MTGQAAPPKPVFTVLQFSLMRVLHWEITQNLNSKQKWPATDLKWDGFQYLGTWNGQSLAHHRGWRACRAEKLWPEICLNPALNLTLFSWILICEEVEKEVLWLNASRRQILQKLHIQLLALCGASEPGRGTGTAPALGTGDGVRLRPDQDISNNSCRPSLLLPWHPPSFHSCQDFINKVGTSTLFHSGN